MEILCGGGYDDTEGYFIEPTVVETKDPHAKLMCEEIFGPVLTVLRRTRRRSTRRRSSCATQPAPTP